MTLDTTILKQSAAQRAQSVLAELRSNWQQMIRAEAPVLILAVAFMVGTLVSMVPVPVVDMVVAGLVMRRLQRLPRGPIVAAMALWNSFIMAPLYATSPRVGGAVLSSAAGYSHLAVPDTLLPRLVVGNLTIALVLALASFLLATALFSALRWQRTLVLSRA